MWTLEVFFFFPVCNILDTVNKQFCNNSDKREFGEESQQKQYVSIGLHLAWAEISFSWYFLNIKPWTNYSSSLDLHFLSFKMRLTRWIPKSLTFLKSYSSNYNAYQYHITYIKQTRIFPFTLLSTSGQLK